MAELTFTVDSALLSELGEKLVETPHIALVELVKNAYDADATEVTVRIIDDPPHGPEVHVVDNGSGMTFSDIERYWMRIATTHKQANNVSRRFGRPRTGSKGIGRFSCRRLGMQLELQTTAARADGHFEQTVVTFDWQRFAPGKEITTIKCEGTKHRLTAATPGTVLKISRSPTDEWGRRGYNFLKRQLAVLAANRGRRRSGYEDDPGFNVRLEAPDFNEPITNVRDRLLSAGWGTLKIKVSADGTAVCTLDAMRVGEKSVTYPEKLPDLAGTVVIIGIMPNDRVEMRDLEVISKGSLSGILDEWGGVYVRYHGFRVYPYGEAGNDWLNIDRDRAARITGLPEILQPFAAKLRGVNPGRAMLSLLSSKSYVGDVEIGLRAHGFDMKASREGFVGDSGIAQLREIIRFGIDWTTIYREYVRGLAAKDDARRARGELERQLQHPVESQDVVSSAIRVVETEVRNLATQLPTTDRQQVLRSLRTATEAIEKHEASSREELRHLQLVASTSTLLLIFSHEVKALLSWLEQVSVSLDRVGRELSGKTADRVADIRSEFAANKKRFVDLLEMTALISVGNRETKPVELALLPRVERAVACFDLIKRSYDIDINHDEIPRSLKVGPLTEAELYAVLLNLLSNAIKAVIAAGGRRAVNIAAERSASGALIRVRDSGIGIAEEQFDNVFRPFIADPENRLYRGLDAKLNPEDKYVVGTGSGLGLSIAREIVMSRGGTIQFVRATDGWKTELQVTLP